MEARDNKGGDEDKEAMEEDNPRPGCSNENNNPTEEAKDLEKKEKQENVNDSKMPTLTDSDSDNDEDPTAGVSTIFKKRKLSTSRNYRQNNNMEEEISKDDTLSTNVVSEATADPDPPEEDENPDPEPEDLDIDSASSDDDDDIIRISDDNDDTAPGPTVDDGAILKTTETLMNKKPLVFPHVRSSNFLKDHHSLQLGRSHLLRPSFCQRQISSLENVRKLHCVNKLEGHEGCVNSLSFNMSGTRIASGSDDLSVIVWDWQRGEKVLQYNTGHRANVFQSKMMPGDLTIASCSRDGQVRLAEFATAGNLRSTKRLAQHKGPAHKMTLIPGTNHSLLSAGEDGQVFMIDIRELKPDKILLLKNDKDKKIPIYSIHSNPVDGNIFCTTGRDQFVRVFDRRFLSPGTNSPELHKLCPEHLSAAHELKAYITCAVFNHNGSQILGSYNDEDIYLFEPENTEKEDRVINTFRGHRNNATVKGVNFYGPDSEYVVSGSDCGNIFIWERDTSALVRLAHGDEGGVVNVLEPHPNLPVLATSGLDDDVKIWQPGPERDDIEKEKQRVYMKETISKNLSDRAEQQTSEADPLDGQMLWVLWRHIRRAERRRREAASARGEEENPSDNSTGEDEDDESDNEDNVRGRICTQS